MVAKRRKVIKMGTVYAGPPEEDPIRLPMDIYELFEGWMEARQMELPTTAESLRARAERFLSESKASDQDRRKLLETVEAQS